MAGGGRILLVQEGAGRRSGRGSSSARRQRRPSRSCCTTGSCQSGRRRRDEDRSSEPIFHNGRIKLQTNDNGNANTLKCQAHYTPGATGTQTITPTYSGDVFHSGSSYDVPA